MGPFVGGLLTDLIDWRWVFFFNVPFTLAALLLTLRNVGESRDTSAQRIDLRGLVAVTLGVAALGLFGLSLSTGWPWYISAFTLAGLGLGISWAYTSVGTQAVVPEAMAGGASGVTLAIVVGASGLSVVVGATLLEVLTAHGRSATDAIELMMAVLAGLAALAAVGLAGCGGLIRAGTAPASSGK